MHIKDYRKNLKKFISAFGLIEVMIAATLLSIGLLGAASIQSQSLNITVESSLKETANNMISQLSDIISSMVNTQENRELQTMIDVSSTSTIPASSTDNACNSPKYCSSSDFYASFFVGWRSSVKLLLNGQSCLCLNKSVNTSGGFDYSIRIAIQWSNLSGAVRQEVFEHPIIAPSIPFTDTNVCITPSADNPAGCNTFLPLP